MNTRYCEPNFSYLDHNYPRFNELFIDFSSFIFIYLFPVFIYHFLLGENNFAIGKTCWWYISSTSWYSEHEKVWLRQKVLRMSTLTITNTFLHMRHWQRTTAKLYWKTQMEKQKKTNKNVKQSKPSFRHQLGAKWYQLCKSLGPEL